ncbi:hypothetical protein L9F63_008821, partial [Diploptera punctata]
FVSFEADFHVFYLHKVAESLDQLQNPDSTGTRFFDLPGFSTYIHLTLRDLLNGYICGCATSILITVGHKKIFKHYSPFIRSLAPVSGVVFATCLSIPIMRNRNISDKMPDFCGYNIKHRVSHLTLYCTTELPESIQFNFDKSRMARSEETRVCLGVKKYEDGADIDIQFSWRLLKVLDHLKSQCFQTTQHRGQEVAT